MGPAFIELEQFALVRIAEYFDGCMSAARTFVRETWLPDAVTTLQTLARESGVSPERRLLFLCDHLREGARTVGATAVVNLANEMEAAVRGSERQRIRALASSSISAICYLSFDLAA